MTPQLYKCVELVDRVVITGTNTTTGKVVQGPQWATVFAIELRDIKAGDRFLWWGDVQVTNDTHKISPAHPGYVVGVSTVPFLSTGANYAGKFLELREGNGENVDIKISHHKVFHRSGVHHFTKDYTSVFVCFGVRCYSTDVVPGDYIHVNKDYGDLIVELWRS